MLTNKEKKDLELRLLKQENALDTVTDCVAKLAKEVAALSEDIDNIKEEFAGAVNKGIEDRWNDGLERIMSYDITKAIGGNK